MKYKWKLRITFSLIGLVILSCGIALAIYFNSDGWKNRADPAASPGHPATDPDHPAAPPEILEALAAHLEEWEEDWKSGNIAALSGPMVFFSEQDYPDKDIAEHVILMNDEDFQKELSDKFGDLLEDAPEAGAAGRDGQNITALLLPYADVTYTLPSALTGESVVEFQIESPDIALMLEGFPAENYESSAVLFESIQTLLASGTYSKKQYAVPVRILQSGSSWMLADSFELTDALYGGLLSISKEQALAAMEAILSQIDAMEEESGTEGNDE